MNKTELSTIINQLIVLGEDRDELNYWLETFDYLEPDQQSLLCANLKLELEAIR